MGRNRCGSIFPCFGMRRGIDLPVGTERIDMASGCVMVKISMRRINKGQRFTHYNGTWKRKHRMIWEQHYGRIPKGYRVIFLDGNKRNTEIDNLELATSNEIMLMTHYGLKFTDKDRTKTGLLIARQRAAIGRLMKQTHNTYNMPKLNRRSNGKV